MGPLCSGILEIITMSACPGASVLVSALLFSAVLCANVLGAEKATSEAASSAEPARGTAREKDLTVARFTTTLSDCSPRLHKRWALCEQNQGKQREGARACSIP
jgi:hypothetical protein